MPTGAEPVGSRSDVVKLLVVVLIVLGAVSIGSRVSIHHTGHGSFTQRLQPVPPAQPDRAAGIASVTALRPVDVEQK
jgi:hypothetical protein